jgi:hypothetical protein
MLMDRHRVIKLDELSAWERTLKGPERTIRETDVAQLIKAAYDDATDEARAEFMAKVSTYPTSAWPWSAVQAAPAMQTRGGGNLGSIAVAKPEVPTRPALLILIRGQAESADVDPGNRLPARGSAEGVEWEPLHKALDAWDTATVRQWIGPQGWVSSVGTTAGAIPKEHTVDGATNGKPTEGATDLPAPQAAPQAAPMWRQPAVLAAGAVALVATGVTVYALTRPGDQARLEAELLRRQREAQ